MDSILRRIAGGLGAAPLRSPVLHTPAEAGLDFENVTFPSLDGVPLEGWFIPAPGSGRIVIANHPMWFSRAGLPAHLEPWRSIWAPSGNDVEVDFVPDYRILHDAGYHVLAYDLRNSGQSGAANGGVTNGHYVARDVLGSLAYVRGRADLRDLAVGLFSRCLGATGTLLAMEAEPAAFRDVRCLVAPQPISLRVALERALELAGLDAARHIDELGELVRRHTGRRLDEDSPVRAAASVRVPTLLYQVRDDVLTRPADVQAIHDAIPIGDKDLFWIEGTTRRWDGYRYFARNPARILAWLSRCLGVDEQGVEGEPVLAGGRGGALDVAGLAEGDDAVVQGH